MMKKIVAANWKMNGSFQQAADLVGEIINNFAKAPQFDVVTVICPPFLYLPQIRQQLQTSGKIQALQLGAQDVSEYEKGAYTGQISASMLAEAGCKYVIIGHSERRAFCSESDTNVLKKCLQVQRLGLIPILCLGETRAEYEDQKTQFVVESQLTAILNHKDIKLEKLVIAYEPIWAIGTGLTATPEQAQKVHHLLRGVLARYDAQLAVKVPILYGGSVKAENAKGLFEQHDINGVLVGGASLDPNEFWGIVSAAND